MNKESIKTAALEMARKGHKVFPVLPNGKACFAYSSDPTKLRNCSQKDRALAGGINLGTSDAAKIEEWFNHELDPAFGYASDTINYGVATNGLCVVDFDVKHDAMAALSELMALGDLPETFTVRSPSNGLHYYFGPADTGQRKLSPNIDIRSRNGYVVGPGSIIDGKPYEIHANNKVAALPAAVKERTSRPPLKDKESSVPMCDLDSEEAIEAGELLLRQEDGAADGNRGNRSFQLACMLKDFGLSEEKIYELMADLWNTKCDPPMDDERLKQTARNAHISGRNRPGCSHPSVEFPEFANAANSSAKKLYKSRCIARVKRKPITWLWKDVLPAGKLTQFAGMPKTGKSQTTCLFAHCVTTGVWPDGYRGPTGSVIFITDEDAVDDTIGPRLDALGVDSSRCHIFDWAVGPDDGKKTIKDLQFDVAHHIPALDQMCEDIGDVMLIVIDPISAYLGKADAHNNAEMRVAMAPLQKFVDRRRLACVLINHFNKNSTEKSALNRVSGSGALGAVCRVNWMAVHDPDDPTKKRRLFVPMGANVGRRGGEGFAYTIEDVDLPPDQPGGEVIETSKAVFDPTPLDMDADEVLGRAGARSEACSFLKSELRNGPVLSVDLVQRAKEAGHSSATLSRAKEQLNTRASRVGNQWYTSLPGSKVPENDGPLDATEDPKFD